MGKRFFILFLILWGWSHQGFTQINGGFGVKNEQDVPLDESPNNRINMIMRDADAGHSLNQLGLDLETPPLGFSRERIIDQIIRQLKKSDYLNPKGVKELTDELGKSLNVQSVDHMLRMSITSIIDSDKDNKSSHIPNAVAALLSAHSSSVGPGDSNLTCRIFHSLRARQRQHEVNDRLQDDVVIKTLKLATSSSEQLETSCWVNRFEKGKGFTRVEIQMKDALKELRNAAKESKDITEELFPSETAPSGENTDQKEAGLLSNNRVPASRVQKIDGFHGDFEVSFEYNKGCSKAELEITVDENIKQIIRRKLLKSDCTDNVAYSNIGDSCNTRVLVRRLIPAQESNGQYQNQLAQIKKFYDDLIQQEYLQKARSNNPMASR